MGANHDLIEDLEDRLGVIPRGNSEAIRIVLEDRTDIVAWDSIQKKLGKTGVYTTRDLITHLCYTDGITVHEPGKEPRVYRLEQVKGFQPYEKAS